MSSSSPGNGRVYLVGAGPGDPWLLTLRALECLRRADVVLYDYLVNPQVLTRVSPNTETICLGRHGGTRLWTQAEINQRMIDLADQGKTVVRLKNGDPAVFARGAEEVESLVAAGIDFEIVPGITTALAAGSYAGIPLTHRDLASAVAFVTGQEHDDKAETALDYDALARFPGTLVVYMGVTTAPTWTAALVAAGKLPETPTAIIRRCSCPDQVTLLCRLDQVATRLAEQNMRPPAIVVVGEVTRLATRYSWLGKRPLFGKRVLVTRPRHQAHELADLLEEQAATVLLQPAISIEPVTDWTPVDLALERLSEFDWLVFSSSNGVRYLLERLLASGRDMRALGALRLAAIGPGTVAELARFHLGCDLMPDSYRAEALAAALTEHAGGKRFLLVRASRGREVLAREIESAGGYVEQVVVYRSLDCESPDEGVAAQLAAGEIHYVAVTSSAIARSLVNMFGDNLQRTRLASLSPVTSATLLQADLPPSVEATTYTMAGLVDAIRADAGR